MDWQEKKKRREKVFDLDIFLCCLVPVVVRLSHDHADVSDSWGSTSAYTVILPATPREVLVRGDGVHHGRRSLRGILPPGGLRLATAVLSSSRGFLEVDGGPPSSFPCSLFQWVSLSFKDG